MSWRYPLMHPRIVTLDPPREGLVQWQPWCTLDGVWVGWVAFFEDGTRRFCYSGVDPDDPTRLVHYDGPYGIPGADDVVS
jgi:hypothetical protein